MASYNYMMSADEVAQELNCSKSHAYKLVKAIRNFCKRETTVFCRGSRHKCSILCKFCFFGFEDTDNSTLKCFSILVNLLT